MRVVIVEDEAPARAALRQVLEEDGDVRVVGETWGEAAEADIREARPDLLFLDVRMPRVGGFEVLRRLAAGGRVDPLPVVVFVTAFEEHAVEAFDVRAVDYVLKPFTDERLRRALERAKARVRAGEAGDAARGLAELLERRGEGGAVPLADAAPDRIVLEDGSATLVLPPSSITWIEASGPYVVIHAEGREHLVRASLSSMTERLGARGFVRVHRSAVVGLEHVREVRPASHGDAVIVLVDGTEVKLSRSRREAFERILKG